MKRTFSKWLLIPLILILIAIPLTLFLLNQQQDVRQRAAGGEADLVVNSYQLVDAGGNVRTTFNKNEDIYVRITIKNQGGTLGISTDGSTNTSLYSHRSTPAAFNDTSQVTITMKNGQYGANTQYDYVSIYGSPTAHVFQTTKSWKRSTAGTFVARAFVNANKKVTESNYDNNQVTFSYTVSDTPTYSQGKTYTTPPTGFESGFCYINARPVPGVEGCVMDKAVGTKTFGRIKNTGTTAKTVGMASYKAYAPYPVPYPSCTPAACPAQYNWIWTQTIIGGITANLNPGATIYFEVPIPSCAWQTDVFTGSITPSFTPPTTFYSGESRYLDGYYNTALAMCSAIVPSATPTPTVIPPTLELSADPDIVPYNQGSVLTWESTNATACTASNAWTGTKAISGTQTTGLLTSFKTYTLTCTGPGGSVTKSTSINVTFPPTIAPTFTPTPTRTPTPTSTPVPTNTPIPTATPVPQATKFSITTFMHGIGNSGDNANPNSFTLSNKNPVRQQRPVTVEVFDSTNTIVLTKTGLLSYIASAGNFSGTIDMGTSLSSGVYTIKIKVPQYLKKRISGIQTITAGQSHTLPVATLTTGDVNNDNALNILDYNIVVGCYSDFAPPVSCTGTQKSDADLTDDGKVNQFDYNLFLRDLTVQNGD